MLNAGVAQSVEHFIGNEEVHEFDSHHQLFFISSFLTERIKGGPDMDSKENSICISPVAYIRNDLGGKFGAPRQSGLCPSLMSDIVFLKEFSDDNAFRGLEDFSHLWIIWGFSMNGGYVWSPTVKPPRLGGNRRMGVFATRSPNRPNPVAISSVRIEGIGRSRDGSKIITVSGADMADGTPVYDVKPYIPYTDSRPDARGGFSEGGLLHVLEVEIPDDLLQMIPEEKRQALMEILACDPRPAYLPDGDLPYGFPYAGMDIRFKVKDGRLTVFEIVSL